MPQSAGDLQNPKTSIDMQNPVGLGLLTIIGVSCRSSQPQAYPKPPPETKGLNPSRYAFLTLNWKSIKALKSSMRVLRHDTHPHERIHYAFATRWQIRHCFGLRV